MFAELGPARAVWSLKLVFYRSIGIFQVYILLDKNFQLRAPGAVFSPNPRDLGVCPFMPCPQFSPNFSVSEMDRRLTFKLQSKTALNSSESENRNIVFGSENFIPAEMPRPSPLTGGRGRGRLDCCNRVLRTTREGITETNPSQRKMSSCIRI